jgi:hypothetical protein
VWCVLIAISMAIALRENMKPNEAKETKIKD